MVVYINEFDNKYEMKDIIIFYLKWIFLFIIVDMKKLTHQFFSKVGFRWCIPYIFKQMHEKG